MSKRIIKVKQKNKNNFTFKQTGWAGVLFDLKVDEAFLQNLIAVVERKIERGEPWPGSEG